MSIAERVESVAAPLLAHDGFELVLVEYIPRAKILRLYIDHGNGITLDDCGQISRQVSDVLDAEGLMDGDQDVSGQYTLEVSSPGLDRPLVRPEHYQRFVGCSVQVVTKKPFATAGRRKLIGKLAEAGAEGICIDAEGERFAFAYDAIGKARLIPEL